MHRGTHVGVELPDEGGEVAVLEVFGQERGGELAELVDGELLALARPRHHLLGRLVLHHLVPAKASGQGGARARGVASAASPSIQSLRDEDGDVMMCAFHGFNRSFFVFFLSRPPAHLHFAQERRGDVASVETHGACGSRGVDQI